MRYRLTVHAMNRIKQRKIAEEEVVEAIKSPDNIRKKRNKYYSLKNFERGTVEVVYEKTEKHIKIITAYWL